jgi:hypothetical protein
LWCTAAWRQIQFRQASAKRGEPLSRCPLAHLDQGATHNLARFGNTGRFAQIVDEIIVYSNGRSHCSENSIKCGLPQTKAVRATLRDDLAIFHRKISSEREDFYGFRRSRECRNPA